jgi:hypothetical protein
MVKSLSPPERRDGGDGGGVGGIASEPPMLLSHEQISRLYRAIVGVGLDRDGLLAGVDPRVVASLPILRRPDEQIMSDLTRMNRVGRLSDGVVPLLEVVQTAYQLTAPRREALQILPILDLLEGETRLARAGDGEDVTASERDGMSRRFHELVTRVASVTVRSADDVQDLARILADGAGEGLFRDAEDELTRSFLERWSRLASWSMRHWEKNRDRHLLAGIVAVAMNWFLAAIFPIATDVPVTLVVCFTIAWTFAWFAITLFFVNRSRAWIRAWTGIHNHVEGIRSNADRLAEPELAYGVAGRGRKA